MIGNIAHARKEWHALSTFVTLQVSTVRCSSTDKGNKDQEYGSGSRQEFLKKCKYGDFDGVVGIYRSNESTSITGPFDNELVQVLPRSLKYIAHNGAGYDNIDVPACTERGIQISSTPIAVNDATADGEVALA